MGGEAKSGSQRFTLQYCYSLIGQNQMYKKRQRGKSLHPITNSFSNHRGKGLFLIRYIIKIIFTLLFIINNIIITVTTVIC